MAVTKQFGWFENPALASSFSALNGSILLFEEPNRLFVSASIASLLAFFITDTGRNIPSS